MFVHAGASFHGHEYSRPSPTQQPRPNIRSPLFMRSALAAPKRRSVDASPRPPALRRRPMSDYIPRPHPPETAVVRFKESESGEEGEVQTLHEIWDRPEPGPGPKPGTAVRLPSASALDDAATDSELSDASQSTESPATTSCRRRKRRSPRKASTYYLGYPTPKLLAKKKVMQKVLPRLMLQLQRVFDDGRSKPVLEIFPATRLAGSVIACRMAKRSPDLFGTLPQLHYDDLVLVRRDEHGLKVEEPEVDDDHGLEERKLLAVYRPAKNTDAVKIVLDDGALWTGTPLRNGSFDFVRVDPQGNTTTARWAKRAASDPSPSPIEASPKMKTTTPETRFTFSIINPLSRRHPVMATLTTSTLSIQETYTSVSSSHARYPPSRPLGRATSLRSANASPRSNSLSSSTRSAYSDDEDDSGLSSVPGPESERAVYAVDETTKMLIGVTAMWVALSSGWSDNYTPPNRNLNGTPADTSAPGTSCGSIKAASRRRWSRNTALSTDSDATSATCITPGAKRYSFSDGVSSTHTRSISPTTRATRASSMVLTGSSLPEPISRRATITRQPSSSIVPVDSATTAAGPPESARVKPRPETLPARPQSEHMRTQPASYASWNTPAVEADGRQRPVAYVVDVPGRAAVRQSAPAGERSPPWSEGDAVDDKKGLRAKLARWLHRLGGR